MNSINIPTGSKFFRYIEGQEEPEVIRIIIADETKVKYYDSNNNKQSMSYKYLHDNYHMLKPDGMLVFSIVSVGDLSDVIVALKRLPADDNLPYAICRQGIYDFFTNNIKKTDNVVYVGVSVSRDTCPANINFMDMLSCTNLKYNRPISVFLDDKLEDILRLFNNKKFDDVLLNLSSLNTEFQSKLVLGYSKTLKELLENNNFMYDFRRCFGLIEVPFHIDEEKEHLSIENTLFLENELKVNIIETYIIKYTREIDLGTIKRDYKLVVSATDKYDKVYIVGFDKTDGEYVPRSII